MICRTLLLTLTLAVVALAEPVATPDDTAKFLAGLPVRGTPLEALARDPAWAEHATEFDKAWQQLETRQLARIRTWSAEFLASPSADKGPMFYMFSGPDILYAHAFFPHASTYVLAGLEPIGALPDIGRLPPEHLAASLANLRKSLNSVLSWSFFITKDMKVDLRQNQLSGTLPILYVFLARAGCRIDSVDYVWLDKSGALSTSKSSTPGVRVKFFGPSGASQALYYFETNLANEGIRNQPGLLKFCEQLGPGRSLVKAASYLMHLNEFSTVRSFLLDHSETIVQDDSGIPVKFFEPAHWAVRYFGSYPGPIDLFKQHAQPDLVAIYGKSNPPALTFGFGYRWQPAQTSLMLATRRRPVSSDSAPSGPSANPPTP